MVPFAGYEMPVQYQGVVAEHQAVRTAAGLFDVSHMGEVAVRGAGALELLQFLTPNDVSALGPGRAQYNALLTERGTFLDDLLVYCRGAQDYLVVVNAAHADQALAWMLEHRERGSKVEIEDQSQSTALIALQGPRSVEILAPLTDVDLAQLRYYRFRDGKVLGEAATVSRTGYTGEDGFELYVEAHEAAKLWQGLLEAGAEKGLVAAGLGARDTLRLEAGMLLSGQDIDAEVTPLEAGLGWVVKLDKGDFVGRAALARAQRDGLAQRLVGFELTGRGIARAGCEVVVEVDRGEGVVSPERPAIRGSVSSGSWSPTLERAIGIARLGAPPGEGAGGTGEGTGADRARLARLVAGHKLEIEVRGRPIEGVIVDLPFYRRPR
jgi:aminomethyltransferase